MITDAQAQWMMLLEHELPESYHFLDIGGQKLFPLMLRGGGVSIDLILVIVHHLSPEMERGGDFSRGGLHDEHDSLWYVLRVSPNYNAYCMGGCMIDLAIDEMERKCLKS